MASVCVLTAAVCGSSACRTGRPDDQVLRYLRLAVALGERDPDAIDYYYGPETWVSDIRAHPPTLAAIKQAALDLSGEVKTSGQPRQDFMIKQLNAIAARADAAQGVRLGLGDEARAFFDLDLPARTNAQELYAVRREIDHLVPGRGSLAKRYADFDKRFTIPHERLGIVMDRAIQGCRERTLQHLKLPPSESLKVEYVADRPWNAYSSYQGAFHSLLRVNVDFALTVDRALLLACHEGYPGHHAYNTLVDAELVQQQHRLELMVQPTFSPQSLTSEAMATYAPEVAFAEDDRLRFEREVLFPLAGIPSDDAGLYLRVARLAEQLEDAQEEVATDYLDGRLEWARAGSALEDQALMLHAEATLKYLNEYRSYMLTYTLGKDMVKECLAKSAPPDRWTLFERLILGRVSIRECAPKAALGRHSR